MAGRRPPEASTPILDALAGHFTGRRRGERRATDARLVLRGRGNAVLQGQAVDVSMYGVRIRLLPESLPLGRKAGDAVAFLRLVEKHFTGSVEVHFPLEEVKAAASVVRLITPEKLGGDCFLACHFLEPLSSLEEARILHEPPPLPLGSRLPFEVKQKGALHLSVFDPTLGEASGPIAVLVLEHLSDDVFEGRLASSESATPETVRAKFERGALPAHVKLAHETAWEGEVRFLCARDGGDEGGNLLVRFGLVGTVGDGLLRHVRPRS